MVSKVIGRPFNNRVVNRLVFLDFWYGVRSSHSTVNLRTVTSDRIARPLNRSGTAQGATLNIFKALALWNFRAGVWLNLSLLINKQLWMGRLSRIYAN